MSEYQNGRAPLRVGRSALMANKIALEREGFTIGQSFNLFKDTQARSLKQQQVYKDDVFKYAGDIEEDYDRKGRLSENIRNPEAPPDDYEKIMNIQPRDMWKKSALTGKKNMSDFYLMNKVIKRDESGRVTYRDADGDGKADMSVSMLHPAQAVRVSGDAFSGANLLQNAENNFSRDINLFKQPRFEYPTDYDLQVSLRPEANDVVAGVPRVPVPPGQSGGGGQGGGGGGGGGGQGVVPMEQVHHEAKVGDRVRHNMEEFVGPVAHRITEGIKHHMQAAHFAHEFTQLAGAVNNLSHDVRSSAEKTAKGHRELQAGLRANTTSLDEWRPLVNGPDRAGVNVSQEKFDAHIDRVVALIEEEQEKTSDILRNLRKFSINTAEEVKALQAAIMKRLDGSSAVNATRRNALESYLEKMNTDIQKQVRLVKEANSQIDATETQNVRAVVEQLQKNQAAMLTNQNTISERQQHAVTAVVGAVVQQTTAQLVDQGQMLSTLIGGIQGNVNATQQLVQAEGLARVEEAERQEEVNNRLLRGGAQLQQGQQALGGHMINEFGTVNNNQAALLESINNASDDANAQLERIMAGGNRVLANTQFVANAAIRAMGGGRHHQPAQVPAQLSGPQQLSLIGGDGREQRLIALPQENNPAQPMTDFQ